MNNETLITCLAPDKDEKIGLKCTSEGIFFNGKAIYFWSGEFPYYRIKSQDWKDRLLKIKAAGVDFITAYIPWNLHEKEEGKYDFSGFFGDERCNLIKFIEEIKRLDMYLMIKPGPFICAEVQHGGIPDWLTEEYPEIVMKDNQGKVVGFRQDKKPLPDFLNKTYLKYVKAWYNAVYENVLVDYEYPKGPVVAMQIENELPYSTSELADPFSWGYTNEIIEMFRFWLKEKYVDIQLYNLQHLSEFKSFDNIEPPRKFEIAQKLHWLKYQDWVMFKEFYGTKTLRIYANIFRELEVEIPFYHNAGMLEDEAPMNFGTISEVMWMGVNFWLNGLPSENLEAYVQGTRRLKQLKGGQSNYPNFAPELNWGWSKAVDADFLTRYTMPFLKGTNIYTVVDGNCAGELNGLPYTNNPEPYPGSSPIDAFGNLTESYEVLKRLTKFTKEEGSDFNLAKYIADITLGFYTAYNSSQVYVKYGNVDKQLFEKQIRIPVGANEFMQDTMKSFIEKNIDYRCVDIKRAPLEELLNIPILIVLAQEIMDVETQEKLITYVRNGGNLVLMPQIPERNLKLSMATNIREKLFSGIDIKAGKADYMEFEKQKEVWTAMISNEKTIAVKRKVEKGELVYINEYQTSSEIYSFILKELDINSSYAFSNDSEVEVISLNNNTKRFNYLFVINRSSLDKDLTISYKDVFEGNIYREIRLQSGMRSVSILKVKNGEILSYSINGPKSNHKDFYL